MPAAALIQMLSHSFHPPVLVSDNDIRRSHYAEGWRKKPGYLTTLCGPSVLVYFSFVELRWSGSLRPSHPFHFSITLLNPLVGFSPQLGPWTLDHQLFSDGGLLTGDWRFVDNSVMVNWPLIYSEYLLVSPERAENEIGARW